VTAGDSLRDGIASRAQPPHQTRRRKAGSRMRTSRCATRVCGSSLIQLAMSSAKPPSLRLFIVIGMFTTT